MDNPRIRTDVFKCLLDDDTIVVTKTGNKDLMFDILGKNHWVNLNPEKARLIAIQITEICDGIERGK